MYKEFHLKLKLGLINQTSNCNEHTELSFTTKQFLITVGPLDNLDAPEDFNPVHAGRHTHLTLIKFACEKEQNNNWGKKKIYNNSTRTLTQTC